jgi:hypothetical protein
VGRSDGAAAAVGMDGEDGTVGAEDVALADAACWFGWGAGSAASARPTKSDRHRRSDRPAKTDRRTIEAKTKQVATCRRRARGDIRASMQLNALIYIKPDRRQ